MRPDQTPTLFVALLMAPDQYGLFEEIEAEAIDILDTQHGSCTDRIADKDTLILLDCDDTRIALGWFMSPLGEVLSVAIGARPGHILAEQDARSAADMARDLVGRAEALFDARRALWQIALMPLDVNAMESHAMQIDTFDLAESYKVGSPFMTIDREKSRSDANETSPTDISQVDTPAPEMDTSWTKQASALALSTTFVLVTPPVGFAMLAYTALRQGADMDLFPKKIDMPEINPARAFAAPKKSYG